MPCVRRAHRRHRWRPHPSASRMTTNTVADKIPAAEPLRYAAHASAMCHPCQHHCTERSHMRCALLRSASCSVYNLQAPAMWRRMRLLLLLWRRRRLRPLLAERHAQHARHLAEHLRVGYRTAGLVLLNDLRLFVARLHARRLCPPRPARRLQACRLAAQPHIWPEHPGPSDNVGCTSHTRCMTSAPVCNNKRWQLIPIRTCASCACVIFLASRAFRICFFSSVGTRSTAWQWAMLTSGGRRARTRYDRSVHSAAAHR